MELFSTLTCPSCGKSSREEMPVDACMFFYECSGCGVVIKPKPGDCCVFCSYGDVACPPIQAFQAGEGEACCVPPGSVTKTGPSS